MSFNINGFLTRVHSGLTEVSKHVTFNQFIRSHGIRFATVQVHDAVALDQHKHISHYLSNCGHQCM